MNQYVTGSTIKSLREKKNMSQSELAGRLSVSDKTVSKWETGKGYPDITLLEPLAKELEVSVTELISGDTIINTNISSNMMRTKYYVCPICGNVIHSTGEAMVTCHGIKLEPLEAEEADECHMASIEKIEDEYYVTINHEMTKTHYISFISAASSDRIQVVKLYPEGNAEARFKINGVRELYYFCNKDGLFKKKITK